jgi:Mrp family chromosome partitioning ATPase
VHCVVDNEGKGGVGKSTVTSQLAIQFVLQGFKVGLLDIGMERDSLNTYGKISVAPVSRIC